MHSRLSDLLPRGLSGRNAENEDRRWSSFPVGVSATAISAATENALAFFDSATDAVADDDDDEGILSSAAMHALGEARMQRMRVTAQLVRCRCSRVVNTSETVICF